MKTKILTIGAKGLVGSRITDLLSDQYDFEDSSRSSGVDITDKESIAEKIKNSSAEIVIQYAAKTDVDGCEKDKKRDMELQSGKATEQDLIREQTAWAINVFGTKNVVQACEAASKKIIYISTDFVFGTVEPAKTGFTEESKPAPVNWYGQTKYEAEKNVQCLQTPWILVRLAYPYRAEFEKKEYVRLFLWLLQQGRQIKAITDHSITPTFIDDIALALNSLIQQNQTGIFHVTGSQFLTPYDVAIKVADEFGLDKKLIGKTTRNEFFKDRAKRPFNLSMNNVKIQRLGVKMRTFDEGLDQIKRQLRSSNI